MTGNSAVVDARRPAQPALPARTADANAGALSETQNWRKLAFKLEVIRRMSAQAMVDFDAKINVPDRL